MPRSLNEFARVYDDHVWDVYGFVRYRVRSREEAEDLTQQAFERALRAWDRFDPRRAEAKTWLLVIAKNLVVDHYRRNRGAREESYSEAPVGELRPGIQPSPEERLGVSPELDLALSSLSDREREAVALRYGGDLTGPQIAEMMDLGLANVHQILSRALRKLRDELERLK